MSKPSQYDEIERRLWRKEGDDTPVALLGRGYGGFWLRAIACIIDGLLINVALGTVVVFKLRSGGHVDEETIRQGIKGVTFLVNWLYFTLMESSPWQATIGKRLMSLEVTDLEGLRISFWRANGRYFAKFLSTLTLGIGFFMAGWTRRKQGLHDMVAGTLVVLS